MPYRLGTRPTTPNQQQQTEFILGINRNRPTTSFQSYRVMPSRIGPLVIRETRKEPMVHNSTPIPSDDEEYTEINPRDYYATLTSLKNLDQANYIDCITSIPLFLRTLHLNGTLDPEEISYFVEKTPQSFIKDFMRNMSLEISFYHALCNLKCLEDVECLLKNYFEVVKANFWYESEDKKYFICPSTSTKFEYGKTVLSTLKNDLVSSPDSTLLTHFSVEYDLPFFGPKNLVLIPMESETRTILSIVYSKQYAITDYDIEVLKIIKTELENRFMKQHSSRNIKYMDTLEIRSFCDLIKDNFCDLVEIYRFNDEDSILTRLNDMKEFTEEDGGLVYQYGKQSQNVNFPSHKSKAKIDSSLTDRSILINTLYIDKTHYVIAFRGNTQKHYFSKHDEEHVNELLPFFTFFIRTSNYIKEQKRLRDIQKQKYDLYDGITKALEQRFNRKMDKWECLKIFTKQYFDSDVPLISLFLDGNMMFVDKDVGVSFDSCLSGAAYNWRNVIEADEQSELINREFYQTINVKIYNSLAFPIKLGRKVIGAFEVVNAKHRFMDNEVIQIISNFVQLLFQFNV